MKCVFSTEDNDEFLLIQQRLRAGGIPVLEPPRKSGLPGFRFRPRYRSLWVWLDEHYHDAILLIENENHVVSRPVSAYEFDQVTIQARPEHEKLLESLHEKVLNWLVCTCAAVAIAIALYLAMGTR